MKPSTALGWHHQGFRLFWIGKIRCGKQVQAGPVGGAGGRSLKLIGTMSSKNPRPEAAVPDLADVPLENHVKSMPSANFISVPTIRFQILHVFLAPLTIPGALCISKLLRTRPANGPLSSCATRPLGTPRHATRAHLADGPDRSNLLRRGGSSRC